MNLFRQTQKNRGKKIFIYLIICLLTFGLHTNTRAANTISAALYQQMQSAKVTIDFKDASILTIINAIQDKTNITIGLHRSLDSEKMGKFTIKATNESVIDVLNKLFKGTGYTFKELDGTIMIVAREKEEVKQEEKVRTITGKIVDSDKKPLVGAMVLIKGSSEGAITDENGEFSLNAENGDVFEFSMMGYKPFESRIRANTGTMLIALEMDVQEMEDVKVVAFGTQKEESIVSSITTVRAKDLKSSSSDLTTQFAGKIAGMIGWQTGGMPGALTEGEMNTKFYIRGISSFQSGANHDPLILLDGVESSKLDLARINPDDIDSFTVLKDATATSMYGARGANGVIIVETKKGVDGTVYTTASYEVVASQPTETIDVVDPITYMQMHTQAMLSRNPLSTPKYDLERINRTASGKYPNHVYPMNDWYNMMFTNMTVNHRMGVSIRGGSKILQYYASINHNRDNGMLKTDKLNDFDTNIKNQQTSVRVNLSINLLAGIKLNINVNANIDKSHSPLTSMQRAYDLAFSASPVDFAAMYPADDYYNWPHLKFGGTETKQVNPYMELHKGYLDRTRFSTVGKAEYIHDLDKLIKGLEFRASVAMSNAALQTLAYTTVPYQYNLESYNFETGKHKLKALNPYEARRTLKLQQPGEHNSQTAAQTENTMQYEARLLHTAAWTDHQTSLTTVFQAIEGERFPGGNLLSAMPHRNISFSMRGSYGYKDKYFAEASFGYNGSERFALENKMGFFPAVGGAWMISKEKFMQSANSWLPFLKLRASYGMVGNDGIIDNPRFVYLPIVNSSSWSAVRLFEQIGARYFMESYANPDILWEISEQANIGLDGKMFNGEFEFTIDAYQQNRLNIIGHKMIPSAMGVEYPQLGNIGSVRSRGIDLSVKYQKQFSNDFWAIINGTLTYSKATYLHIEEASNKPIWQQKEGQDISKQLGYIAEGLFSDETEIKNSPFQGSDVMPGDIRYRDLNGDNVIDVEDATFIGFPETPRLIYGINGFINYKGFEFNFAFQGSGNRSFFMDPVKIQPFVGDNNMLKAIYDDHWSVRNQSENPLWPRLSTLGIAKHNIQEDWYGTEGNKVSEVRKSTYFMRECSFIRCTSLELGYYIPQNITSKLRLKSIKFFARTNNPFVISNFDIWDIELGEDGFNYPIQRTYSFGINVSF